MTPFGSAFNTLYWRCPECGQCNDPNDGPWCVECGCDEYGDPPKQENDSDCIKEDWDGPSRDDW